MKVRPWRDLTTGQRALVVVVGSAQMTLAVLAWADLATRSAAQVNGSKLKWAAIIAINWIGPLSWFRWGRRGPRTPG